MPAVEQVKPDPWQARAVHERNAAVRALDDPIKLNRAARIIREALARGVVTLSDIDPARIGGGPDAPTAA